MKTDLAPRIEPVFRTKNKRRITHSYCQGGDYDLTCVDPYTEMEIKNGQELQVSLFCGQQKNSFWLVLWNKQSRPEVFFPAQEPQLNVPKTIQKMAFLLLEFCLVLSICFPKKNVARNIATLSQWNRWGWKLPKFSCEWWWRPCRGQNFTYKTHSRFPPLTVA